MQYLQSQDLALCQNTKFTTFFIFSFFDSKGNIRKFIENLVNKIFYGILILIVISVLPVNAQTNPITVETDDSIYDEGDTIVISGQVAVVVPGTPVVLQVFHEGNLVDIAQIVLAQDGSYTHTIIAEGPLWDKVGDYLVRASFGEGNIAESEFNFTPKTESIETTKSFEVDAGSSGTFDVEYTIKGGEVKDMSIDSESFALIVEIDAIDEGVITLELPREFIDAEKQNGKDDIFIILIDNIEVPYQEIETNSDYRTITINFEQLDSEIMIIGTFVIPEFGIIAIILLIGIASMILLTKSKLMIKV